MFDPRYFFSTGLRSTETIGVGQPDINRSCRIWLVGRNEPASLPLDFQWCSQERLRPAGTAKKRYPAVRAACLEQEFPLPQLCGARIRLLDAVAELAIPRSHNFKESCLWCLSWLSGHKQGLFAVFAELERGHCSPHTRLKLPVRT